MNFITSIWIYIKNLPRLYSIGGAIVIIALGAIGAHALTRSAAAPSAPVETAHVHVATVADLSANAGTLSVIGKVTSLNEATILAQTSGQVVSLNVQSGDKVSAGQVLGTFENAGEVAAVQQAEGAYDAAIASQSATSLPDAATQAQNTYRSAYTTADTVLENDVDLFFGSPTPYGPAFLINADGADPVAFSRERASLDTLMDSWRDSLDSADSTDPETLLDTAYDNTQRISTFITELAAAANSRDSRATSTQITALTAARASIDAELQTISTARDTYQSKSVGATAGTSAGIEEALGALNGAKANLEKTIIRAPISGTIVTLPITLGDFVTAFSQVAEISNPSALEIDTYVTPDDAKTLATGASATIEGGATGTITSIAPALDPSTGKIEVKVGIDESQDLLTDGDTVSVSLTRAVTLTVPTTSAVTIPIIATKITPVGPVVFTVTASSTLSAVPITLGTILGDRVTVTSGLATSTDMIVTDARGLSAGDTVIVDTP